MNDLVTIVNPAIEVVNDQPMVSSLFVAEHFRRTHKNVLRDIGALDCSERFNRLNFEPIEYTDPRGRVQPAIRMTRDGFMFLVMGYTGREAARIKEAYIAKFNEYEATHRLAIGNVQLPARELTYLLLRQRELIQMQRRCIRQANQIIRYQKADMRRAGLLPTHPVAASNQGDLFAQGGAA